MGKVTDNSVMRRRRGLGSAIVGLTVGFLLGLIMMNYRGITSSQMAPTLGTRGSVTGGASARVHNLEANVSGKNLVFVGVMTAHKYLGTRAKAVWETWGKTVPGKIAFFSSGFSTLPVNTPDLPLVALATVDDGYPPQKKSFLMLQYMWNHFGDQFEWFLRADDDVYVRSDRLERLLRSVDSRKAIYIGQAGRGNSEEFGLLSLEYDENFCMGGPGVILSRETLGRIVPHIKECLRNLYTSHEDVELGRCVRKHAGIPCTWSYEMQSILYHNSSGDQAFTGNLKKKEVHRAITLHPVKSPPHMYRLHNYMRGLRIQDLKQERIKLHRDITVMIEQLGMTTRDFQRHLSGSKELSTVLHDIEMLGVPAGLRSFKPRSSREVVPWDFISRSEYSLADANPRRRIHSHIKEGLEDITREVMDSINACSRQRGRVVEERSALYGYRRVDAYGADTILDLLLVYRKYRGRKVTLPVRRHVYVHQHYTGIEIREVVNCEETDRHRSQLTSQKPQSIFNAGFLGFSSAKEIDPIKDKSIRFILPLSGRFHVFQRFLRNYEEICLMTGDKTELLVVLYPHRTDNSVDSTMELINRMRIKYSSARIEVIPGSGNFSRAQALNLGVSQSREDDLMFFVDVDIVLKASALQRIRLNTVIGRQVYFPIVFSQFDPKIVRENSNTQDPFLINEFTGFWRQFGFGIVSLYKKDYLSIGGFDLSITGWGKEDVDFFEKAVKSKLNVFRAPDKHLVHVFHDVECDERLSGIQLSMCRGTRVDTFGSTQALARIVYDNPEYLRFARARRARLTAQGN
ncbi:chondroitin sulfate synthase 1 [Diachasma alloeum]|uniref:chondroitin sulfate synthase 1 n=1 Tax=Diachasma alloeum TaxID=454923 RepID=UPI0007383274|nr:chondroitin sulfate synthase 1 [Diachasma alloeum]XP_015126313.1 chondroitin sulfate synthase 1 [Diachasma alloeum]